MSPLSHPNTPLLPIAPRRLHALAYLVTAAGLLQSCAATLPAPRAPSMLLQSGEAAQHRQLRGVLDARMVGGPVTLTAYVFTQPGSLISLFARPAAASGDAAYHLDVRVPRALSRQPLLVRASGRGTFLQVLVLSQDQGESDVEVPAMDDTTTVVAQTYAAARAAQIWPTGTDPDVLNTILSPPWAAAVRRAANPERTLAAITPGLVAAVSAWQAVLAHRALGQKPVHDFTAAPALRWSRGPGSAGAPLVTLAALEVLPAGPDGSSTVALPQHLALAAQASADAWRVYADKLPWDLRGEALVDAAALQARFIMGMVTDATGPKPTVELDQAAANLLQTFAWLRSDANRAAPASINRQLTAAWQRYVAAAIAQLDGDVTCAGSDADDLGRELGALRAARNKLNSRVAPAQTAASMAAGYVAVYCANQQVARLACPSGAGASWEKAAVSLALRNSLALSGR